MSCNNIITPSKREEVKAGREGRVGGCSGLAEALSQRQAVVRFSTVSSGNYFRSGFLSWKRMGLTWQALAESLCTNTRTPSRDRHSGSEFMSFS